MKKEKLSRLAALLTAGAMLFGGMFMGCSSGDDSETTDVTQNDENPSTNGNQSQGDDPTSGTPAADKITVTSGSETVYTGNDINEAWTKIGSSGNYTIKLAKGTYSVTEGTQLSYNGAANIKISGDTTTEYGADVIISGNPKTASQKSRELVYLPAGSTGNLVLENVRFVNEYGTTKGDAQAEVLATDGSGNLAAYNCSFFSGQDTLRTVAKAWFYKCYIEGDVDFLWMETTGTVALYEECVLHAIGTRTDKAYFAAPRSALTTKVGKGLVVYNSKLTADKELSKLYLARNPWASSALTSYYNNVAFVGTEYTGKATITDLWASASNGTTDKQFIGFKADSNFTASTTTHGVVLSDSVKAAEYAGRKNILNRVYNVTSGKYQKDTEAEWDIDAVISANGWTVTEDTSKALLDGEEEVKSTTYDFSNDISTYTDITVGETAFANESGKSHIQGQAGATLSFPVTGKCVVTVTGYYKGDGTIKANSQGVAILNFNNNSTTNTIEKAYTVYSGAGTVTIAATSTMYIKKIVVEYDDSLTFVPVTGITVTAAENATEVASKKTLQFSAALTPADVTNSDIVWSIESGSEVASIDQNGLLTAGSADADTSVTVRVTSCDANAVYGEATVTVKKLEANAFDISWLDSDAHSDVSNVACTNGNDSIATGCAGTLSSGTVGETSYGSWQKNSSKWNNAAGGLSFVTTAASVAGWDAIYIDFPVTAVKALKIENVKVTYGAHGTGNPLGKISYSLDNGSTFTEIATDTSGTQKTTQSYDTDVTLAAGASAIIRVALGHSDAGKIAASKSPTICTVIVSGSATE